MTNQTKVNETSADTRLISDADIAREFASLGDDRQPLSTLHKLSALEEKQIEYQAKVIDQVTALMAPAKIPELFFSTKARHRYVYDRVPVGHDVGYRCYDGSKHDSESAFESGEYGDGLSENEAYADLMKDEVPIRTKSIDCSREEPNEVVSAGSPHDWEKDDE